MRKFQILGLLLALLFANVVQANETHNKWFLGADGGLLWYSGYEVLAASIYGGYRWQQLGLVAGYTKPFTNNLNTGSGGAPWVVNNSQNIYIDGMGFYRISNKLEFLGRIGFGYFKAKIEPLGAYNDWSYRSGGARVGLGMLYLLSERVQAGAFYVLQTTNSNFPSVLNLAGVNITYYLR